MTYNDTVQYLFRCTPMFQNVGGPAYKEGLQTTEILDAHFGHPHRNFKTIHIAGTNGKGSCAHSIAAILQMAGYRVGLYTSPHLVDFRERIRVNGKEIPKRYVINFVKNEKDFFEPLHPSFFELTTALAFKYFSEEQVDVAVIEVGLGGRLDCTNIIHPELSVITNIALDHTQFLGHTLAQIAGEKAGIIKWQTPVVVGEYNEETRPVFEQKAREMQAPLIFAQDDPYVYSSRDVDSSVRHGRYFKVRDDDYFYSELTGVYQEKNLNTVLTAVEQMQKLGFHIEEEHVEEGMGRVCKLTGLKGRWQILSARPYIVCDTAHNPDGFKAVLPQIFSIQYRTLRMIIGMVSDKDIDGVLSLLPKEAVYYFTTPSVSRALPSEQLMQRAAAFGLHGQAYPSVYAAYCQSLNDTSFADMIYVGGSNFVVADFLKDL